LIIQRALFAAGQVCAAHTAALPRDDGHIERICALYLEAQRLECSGDAFFRHDITLNTNYPAIGLQTTAIRFIYFPRQVNPERNPCLPARTLKNAVVIYNIATSARYTMEYLYDGSGEPSCGYSPLPALIRPWGNEVIRQND
jgi:hypothetical protein